MSHAFAPSAIKAQALIFFCQFQPEPHFPEKHFSMMFRLPPDAICVTAAGCLLPDGPFYLGQAPPFPKGWFGRQATGLIPLWAPVRVFSIPHIYVFARLANGLGESVSL